MWSTRRAQHCSDSLEPCDAVCLCWRHAPASQPARSELCLPEGQGPSEGVASDWDTEGRIEFFPEGEGEGGHSRPEASVRLTNMDV